MLVFVCTDLHGQRVALRGVEKQLQLKKYDAVFMLGDLCMSHDLNALIYANNFIDIVQSFNIPLYVVHGNQEPISVRLLYQTRGVTVHFNERQLGSYTVVGVGYGDIFPTDPRFADNKILLTHEPPRAKMIANMKQKGHLQNAPYLHLSGHLHFLARTHLIGQTVLVQVPGGLEMRAAEINLETRQVKFIHLSN